MEKCELLYALRFHLSLKVAVYKRYVRQAIQHGCKVWCQKESEGQRDRW